MEEMVLILPQKILMLAVEAVVQAEQERMLQVTRQLQDRVV
jgi:hypothetical protein